MQTKILRIALIGAGQIGSRHLQAISRINRWPVEVLVVEPDQQAVGIAQGRLRQVVSNVDSGAIKVTFSRAIEGLPGDIDIAIVATSSAVRRKCIEHLLAHASVRFLILEKILFQLEEDYHSIAQLLAAKGIKTWVNCPRRMWPVYQAIHNDLATNSHPVELQVTGANWGLGCNSIHMLDLFAFLAGSNDIELDGGKLDPDPIPSKRAEYSEFTGLLTGRNARGSACSLLSNRSGNLPFAVVVAAGEKGYLIVEDAFQVSMHQQASCKWEVQHSRALRQSELTNQVIEILWATGSCPLTPFADSAQLHVKLIRCLNGLLEQYQGKKITLCPIT